MNLPGLRIHDSPDLYSWGGVPIITIEQAALLWGGIDPAFYLRYTRSQTLPPRTISSRHDLPNKPFGGIVMKTLEAHELYLCDFNNSYRADQRQESFTFEDIDTRRTIVQTNVLIEWAQRRDMKPCDKNSRAKKQYCTTANFPINKDGSGKLVLNIAH